MKALPVEPNAGPVQIGSRIRASRQAQRFTIEQVAEASGLTKGFLSRVERDLTSPSVASLLVLCQVLSISIGDLFTVPSTHLVRAGEAPKVSLGGVGIVERLLTERSERRLQVLHAEIEPYGKGEDELYTVDCEVDVLHIIEGELTLRFSNDSYDLRSGDTLSFPGHEPHSWTNHSAKPVRVLWILAPAASR